MKDLVRSWQDLAGFLERSRGFMARSCRIFLKDLVRSWQDLAGFLERSRGFMARSCRIFGKILWNHDKILQDSWQDPAGSCQFLAGSWQDPVRTCKDLARSLHDLAGFMSRSWQDHDRILAKILSRSYKDLAKIVNLGTHAYALLTYIVSHFAFFNVT